MKLYTYTHTKNKTLRNKISTCTPTHTHAHAHMLTKGAFPLRLRCATLRYAAIVSDSERLDIETLSVFLYLSQRATQL